MSLKIAAFHAFLDVEAGAAGAFLNMVRSLNKRGHEIDIYTLRIAPEIKRALENNYNVFYEVDCLKSKDYFNFLNIQRVKQKIIKNRNYYDILFASHYNYSPFLLYLLRKISLPKVYYCYEPPRIYYEPILYTERSIKLAIRLLKIFKLPAKYIDRLGIKFADLVLCNSHYVRECIWRTYGIFAVTNYLGVDLEKHKRVEIPKENIILTVGVLQPHKAHDFVIRSLGLVPPTKRPKFVIITSGYSNNPLYKEKLYNLAKLNNVNLEIYEHYIPHEKFAELHSKAKLFVIPFIMEPSVEPVAFAYELPIVAVREGGVREVILDGETGILTERDEKEFAAAIEFLLDHPDIATKMGQKGKEWVKMNFTWEKCAENLERNFKKVLANR